MVSTISFETGAIIADMMNKGILPRDGKNITFTEMNQKVRETYNFAPSFCFFVPNYAANMLKKDYNKDTFDLSELDVHNGIEHDASLTRVYPPAFVIRTKDLPTCR